MKTAKKGDTVVLAEGSREKMFVVLGFTKTHVSLATPGNYSHAIAKDGEYSKMKYGYTAWNLQSGAVQKGFWSLLKTVNGKEV